MSIQFYYGASGSGKSKKIQEYIIEEALKDKKRNFLLVVPDQFTMQTQKDLVCAHPNKGIMNIDVLSFGRLSHRIFEEVGGQNRTILDDTGKSLILRKVAENTKSRLPVIGGSLHRLGYIHEVKSVLSEFMQYGIGERELTLMLERSKTRGALHAKLSDLAVLYREFENYIKDRYITTEETLDALCNALDQSNIIKDSIVVFDGFTGFTPIQYRVIEKIMTLTNKVIFSIIMDASEDPSEMGAEQALFHMSKKTIHDLRKIASDNRIMEEPSIVLGAQVEPRFEQGPEIAFLEKNLFRYPAKEWQGPVSHLHMTECDNPKEEVRQTFITIKKLLADMDLSYRDIAIVTGSQEVYNDHLANYSAEYGIPVYLDRTKGILLNPLMEYIRGAENIFIRNFDIENIFHFLKSGLADFTPDEVDILEDYCKKTGIRGKKKWTQKFLAYTDRVAGREDLIKINELRERLVTMLEPLFEQGDTIGDRVKALYEFLVQTGIQSKLWKMADEFASEGDFVKEKEYRQIYRLTMDLLDQIYSLLADEKTGLREFCDILDAGFAEIEVGSIPQDVDRVLVGDMERTRLKEIKVLFFLGINDGNIPGAASTGGLISDIDREFLQRDLSDEGIELAPTPRQQMYTQRLYLYMNMTKPSKELYLSYSKLGNDKTGLRPSYLVDAVRKLFPELETKRASGGAEFMDLESHRDAMTYLANGIRKYADGNIDEAEKSLLFSLYSIYENNQEYQKLLHEMVDTAFYAYQPVKLRAEIAKALYGATVMNSISRLEKFASCQYAHFLRYGMQLSEDEEYGFESVDMGTVFHAVLERFSKELQSKKLAWTDFDEKFARDVIHTIVENEAAIYDNQILFSTSRRMYMLENIKRIMLRSVLTMQSQLRAGKFVPSGFEVSFGKGSIDEIGQLADGTALYLQGKIDRVDLAEEDSKVYVKIVDYKSGKKAFQLGYLYYGLQLQLVIYMNAALELEKKKYPDKEIVPAAMLYYHIDDPIIKSDDDPGDAQIVAQIQEQLKTTGIVNDSDDVNSLLDATQNATSVVIPVAHNKDGSISKKSSIISSTDWKYVSDYARKKAVDMGSMIAEGHIAVNPVFDSSQDACKYCTYKGACGFDRKITGYSKRALKKLDTDMAMQQIRDALQSDHQTENTMEKEVAE